MKTIKRFEVHICDECKKEIEKETSTDFQDTGENSIDGWYHLKKTDIKRSLRNTGQPEDWDFCSPKCLREFVTSEKFFESLLHHTIHHAKPF